MYSLLFMTYFFVQWWIQDFPDGKRQPQKGGGSGLLFGKILAENSMKLKEIGLRGRQIPSAIYAIRT